MRGVLILYQVLLYITRIYIVTIFFTLQCFSRHLGFRKSYIKTVKVDLPFRKKYSKRVKVVRFQKV